MWLHLNPDQALGLAIRFCAVARLIGLLELGIVRRELAPGGFLDWTMIGNLSPHTRTRAGSIVRRASRLPSARAFAALVMFNAVIAVALLLRPSSAALIAAAAAVQLLLLKRHHLTDRRLRPDGLGRAGGLPAGSDRRRRSQRPSGSLVPGGGADTRVLRGGILKGDLQHWRSGNALPIIAATRMYGHPAVARSLRAQPAMGRAASRGVLIWESLFLLALTAPPAVVLAMLVAGVAFHAGCAIVMGLNRFIWQSWPDIPLCCAPIWRSATGSALQRRTRSR